MRRKSPITPVCSGLAILAGSFSFMGPAQAATLLSEDFEGVSNVFGASTYNYSTTYTMANLLVPGGGLKYLNGGSGVSGAVSTNVFTATGSPLSLLAGGITGAQIDGGLVNYNFYAQFSSYRQQNDHGTLAVQFLDAGSSPLGSELRIGGAAIVSGLGMGISGYGNPDFTDMRDWAADSLAGLVPAGARFASVQIFEVKSAGGLNIDGYMDNINLSIAVVPEPGSVSLLALGGGLATLLYRRRRR
jgi:PEP-CTERM motif